MRRAFDKVVPVELPVDPCRGAVDFYSGLVSAGWRWVLLGRRFRRGMYVIIK